MKRKFLYFAFILLSMIVITGCSEKYEQTKLKEKVYEEIRFLERNIDELINDFFDKKYDLNWNAINKEVELIYSTWGNLAIDLSSLGSGNDEILKFGDEINNAKQAASVKQENMILKSLINLYSYIPKYLVVCSDDSFEIAKKNIKYNIISSVYMAKINDWEQTAQFIEIAENEYLKLMDNLDYANNNQYNLNKVYILLEELKKSIDINDYDLFLMKYNALAQILDF